MVGTAVSTTEPQDGGSIEQVEDLSYDECFDLLSNHRRRYTLYYVTQNGEQATIGELSDQIAAWENGVGVDAVSYDERKRVYTSLQQVHLPRMDENGVIEFDDREGTVDIGPTAEDLEVYLEVVREDDVPWSQFYLGLAGVNGGVLSAAVLGLPGFHFLSGIGLAMFAVTTFLIAAVAHVYLSRTEMQLGGGG